MRSLNLLLVALTGEAVARSHIHAHGHRRLHEKKDTLEETVTVVECWLDGHMIPKVDCDAGIANGNLKWADDGSIVVANSAPPQVSIEFIVS